MKQEYKSSANLGQLKLSILDSWYVTNSIFNLILDFVQSNQSYDFKLRSDLQWDHLMRFTDEQLRTTISKRGNTNKNKDKFPISPIFRHFFPDFAPILPFLG